MTNGVQFSKSLSLGHIIATVGIVVAGFTFIYDLRESISILQFKGDTVEQRLERIVNRTDKPTDVPNTIKLVAKKIVYNIDGTTGGQGGFTRTVTGVKRFESGE